jgi:hypothetical protein
MDYHRSIGLLAILNCIFLPRSFEQFSNGCFILFILHRLSDKHLIGSTFLFAENSSERDHVVVRYETKSNKLVDRDELLKLLKFPKMFMSPPSLFHLSLIIIKLVVPKLLKLITSDWLLPFFLLNSTKLKICARYVQFC